ncbi:MAG: InlB B-repeat-containing protein [Clostridiales bacterium]|nr:InlB B-repeat-containing protein [Clostridiales bacterium]
MKRKQRTFLSLLLACVLTCVPGAQALAVSYDVTADLSTSALFPGDTLTGISEGTIIQNAAGEQIATADGSGSWENTSDDEAYSVSYQAGTEAAEGVEATPAMVTLTTAGYVLTVVDGTSESAAADGTGTTENHYSFTDEEKTALEEKGISEDIAYYQSGESVKITAAEPDEGYEFAGWTWTVTDESVSVSVADTSSAETTLTMTNKGVTVTANYQEKVVETEAPVVETEAPVVETEAPVVETEAAVVVETEAAVVETEAAVVETEATVVETEAPVVETEAAVVVETEAAVVVETEAAVTQTEAAAETDAAEDDSSADVVVIDDISTTDITYSSVSVYGDTGADAYVYSVVNTYAAGDTVTLTADTLSGYTFSGWYVSTLNVALEDLTAQTISFTVPDTDVTLLATYTAEGTEETTAETTVETAAETTATEAADVDDGIVVVDLTDGEAEVSTEGTTESETSTESAAEPVAETTTAYYTVTRTYVSGENEIAAAETDETTYAEGATYTLSDATAITGYTFDSWTVMTTEDKSEISLTTSEDGTSFTMPAADVTIVSNYTEIPPTYTLTISYVSDDGTELQTAGSVTDVESGTAVSVSAPAISGYTFTGWSVDLTEIDTDTATFADSASADTTFTMPSSDVTIKANYTVTKYTLSIVSGSETSTVELASGATYTLADATTSETGKTFDTWTVTSGTVTLEAQSDGSTLVTMSASDATLTASFKNASYTVTVDGGTTGTGETSGTFEYGSTVSIIADTAEDGYEFDGWTVADDSTEITLAAASSPTTSFTMPAGNVTLEATYVALPDTYTVTVSNGLIDGSYTSHTYEDGAQITVTANAAPNGQEFAGWEVLEGDYDLGDDASATTLTLVVDGDLSLAATYTGVKYSVTVSGGSADYSEATADTTVTITAAAPETGYEFDSWTVDTQNVTLADASSSTTTFTMPSADVKVTANYKLAQYTLTVVNGTTSQTSYYYGDTVTLTANYPASGKEFSAWTASSGDVTFTDTSRATTTATLPAGNVTITATYEDGPTEANNYISGITEGGSYLANEKLTFTPVGAGMSNTNPNPGDIRYVPTGYQIGNVSNTWSSSPYETSMSIKKTGEYTLKVTFARQVYDGSSWVADGTTSTTSVTFNIVNSLESVQTGDSTPIFAVAAIAIVACLIFIIVLVVFIRRRRSQR